LNLRHIEHKKVIGWVNDKDRATYASPTEIERALIVCAWDRLEVEAKSPIAA
jgi:hypothetical protein